MVLAHLPFARRRKGLMMAGLPPEAGGDVTR